MREFVARGFYPWSPSVLSKEVEKCLFPARKINSIGAIVPHAGYSYSGSVAGLVYNSISTDKKIFLVIGPNHTGLGSRIAYSNDDWSTPLGVVKNSFKGKGEEQAHRYEHSIEVQLPFLQKRFESFSIIPLVVKRLSFKEIEELVKDMTEDCFYIASSDFIHFGPAYDYMPVSGTAASQLEWTRKIDHELIKKICNLDADGFYNSVAENGYTVCGYVPITILLLIMKKAGAKRGILIKYKSSFDVQPSDSFVNYAGIVFEK